MAPEDICLYVVYLCDDDEHRAVYGIREGWVHDICYEDERGDCFACPRRDFAKHVVAEVSLAVQAPWL